MSEKLIINADNTAYTATSTTPTAVLVPKDKNHLVPKGTPYINILSKPTPEQIPENSDGDFNPTETIITFDMFDKFCEDTLRDKPFDQEWGRGKRPVINITSLEGLYFVNWVAEQTRKFHEAQNVFGDNVKIVMPYIIQYKKQPHNGMPGDRWWFWLNPEIETLRKEGFTVHYPAIPVENQWATMLGNAAEQAKTQLGDIAWYNDNSNNMTHPVAEKLPNSLGIYDILGNVWKMILEKDPPFMTESDWAKHNFPGAYMQNVDWFGTSHNNWKNIK